MPGRQYSGGGSHQHHHHHQHHHPNHRNSSNGVGNNISSPGAGRVNGAGGGMTINGRDRDRDRDGGGATAGRGGYTGKGGNRRWGMESYLADDENYPSFQAQLVKLSLQLRDIPADGNCLFRALGDQLEGHCRNHYRHRTEVAHYMKANRTDFEPFVEDDMSFDKHLLNLQKLGTHAGNDAIVAFAKLHASNVVIHQLNGKPLLIQGPQNTSELTRQLHIAYHNGDHYSSVRRKGDNTESPAQIRLEDAFTDGPDLRKTFKQSYNGVVSAKRDLEDIEYEVQMATNCMDMSRVRESLIECDYDVDASIADLLQQMEMMTSGEDADASPLPSPTATTNGEKNAGEMTPEVISHSNDHPLNSSLKSNGQGSAGGKGHKVHFREDSIGSSSGYGSMNSKDGGARPKSSHKKTKEERKLEKKRRAEEARRQKFLQAKHGNGHNAPAHPEVRDVTVVSMKDKFTHI